MEKQRTVTLYQHHSQLLTDSFDDIIIRLLRKNHEETDSNGKTLLLCGSDPGVGTTTVAINLAIALAQSGRRTLLLDSDIRKDSRHKRLNSTNALGFSSFLEQNASIDEIICETNYENLHYIPSGYPVEHSLRLLGSSGLAFLVDACSPHYDFILFDSPSLDAANDAIALSLVVDSVLIVAAPGLSGLPNLHKMKQVFNEPEEKVVGVIVNKVNRQDYRDCMKHFDYFSRKKYLTWQTRIKTNRQGR